MINSKAESDNRKSVKTAMLNTIASILSLVIGMVMIPIIARLLPTEDVGMASTFLSTRNTAVILVTFASYSYVNKAMLEFKNEKLNYILSVGIFCLACTLVAFTVALPLKEKLIEILSLDEFLFYWLFVSIFIFAIYHIALYYAIFHNKAKIVFVINLSVGPVSQLLAVILPPLMRSKKYIGRVVGLDFVYFIVAIVFWIWLLFFVRKKTIGKKYIIDTLKFTIPIVPHLLSQMVLTQCDLLMISYYCGEDKAGIYSMGHTVGYLGLTVISQIMAVWTPWSFRRWESNDSKSVYKNSREIVLLGFYISIGLLTVATELIHIFLPAVYLPCIYIVPPLVVGMFFQFIYLFIYDVEYYNKKSNYIAIASSIAAIVNLVLNYVCIPRWGYLAAGYTTVFSYFVLVVASYLIGYKLDIKSKYQYKYHVMSIVIIIAYAMLMMILNNIIIIRYFLFAAITGILVKLEFGRMKNVFLEIRGNKEE